MSDLNKLTRISKLDAQERSEGTAAACGKWAADGFALIRRIEMDLHDGLPELMGMDANEWKSAYCGSISRSHLNRQLQISRELSGLPTKELMSLGEGKAYELLKLPPVERTKSAWLDKAKDRKVSLDAFRGAVAHATGRDKETAEKWATFSLKAPVSVCESAHALLKHLAIAYGLDIELKPDSAFIPFEKLAVWALQLPAPDLFKLIEGE